MRVAGFMIKMVISLIAIYTIAFIQLTCGRVY